MNIEVTLEDTRLEDLFVQHLAEQTNAGHIVDLLWGLVIEAMQKHPDWRECPNDECAEILYPRMATRQVFDDSWKPYRVDVLGPVETCPKCGTPTVRHSEIPFDAKAREFFKESNRRFAEGRITKEGAA